MSKLILKNGQGLVNDAIDYFMKIKGSFRLTKQILDNIPDDIVEFTSSIDNIIVNFDKLNNILNNNKISNQQLVNTLTKTSSRTINTFFKSLLKIIVSNNLSKTIYQEKGLIKTIRTFLSLSNDILIDLNSEIVNVSERLANSNTKLTDIKFSTMIYFNIYSVMPLIIYMCEKMFDIISIVLSDDNIDSYSYIAKILNTYNEHLLLIWNIVFNSKFNSISKSIDNNIKKKGIDYNIFNKVGNLFSFMKVINIPKNLLDIFRLSKTSKGLLSGESYLVFKTNRILKLNDKKNYMDMRILYLKSKLSNNKLSKEEIDQIKSSIEYYENKIQKLDKKINDLYL